MTSQVYYRKWRPNNFANLAGQKHIRTTIQNAITKDRIAHSYLFCGPRGTGKTSTARILAKAVNCLNPDSGDPCNHCDPCISFNEGTFLDLIELDAASNRGIDDIREIREKINFSPAENQRLHPQFPLASKEHDLRENGRLYEQSHLGVLLTGVFS